jgi:hypothetical protein
MTDDVSADVAFQDSTPQVPNSAPSPPHEPGRPRQLRRPKNPLGASLPTAEIRRLRTRSFPTSIRQNQTTTTNPSGPVIRGTLSQIPAAPTPAPTSHFPTTTTVTLTSQLPTLRKTLKRADISKRLSTLSHPTGTAGSPGRTSKKHSRRQDLTEATFPGRLSSGTPTLTGLWPVARQAPSRRQKSSTLPLRSCACNFIVATSLLRSIPSSTRTRAGIWKTIDFVSLESTSSCLPDLISSRDSKDILSLKPLLKPGRPAFAHSSAEDLFRPRHTRYTCRPTPGPRYQQQPFRKTDTVGDPLL